MSEQQYKGVRGRDIMALDEEGGHYTRHVMAMTVEKLHSKSDIAAELAHRDSVNERLVYELERIERRLRAGDLDEWSTIALADIARQALQEVADGD